MLLQVVNNLGTVGNNNREEVGEKLTSSPVHSLQVSLFLSYLLIYLLPNVRVDFNESS